MSESPTASTVKPAAVSVSSPPLVLIEVTPLSMQSETAFNTNYNDEEPPSLSAPFVKLRLLQRSLNSVFQTSDDEQMRIEWLPTRDEGGESKLFRGDIYCSDIASECRRRWALLEGSRRLVPLFYLEGDDPTQLRCPCWVVGYRGSTDTGDFCITESTLVRISTPVGAVALERPALSVSSTTRGLRTLLPMTDLLSGTVNVADSASDCNSDAEKEVIQNHDSETVEALKLRMGLLLSQKVTVGTTADAIPRAERKMRQRGQMLRFLQSHKPRHPAEPANVLPPNDAIKYRNRRRQSLAWEGALTVHNPAPGSGKTLLVKTIARRYLQCTAIHLIQPGSLLAKYGIHADAGLESLIHEIAVNASIKDGEKASVCVILDQLDALLPPAVSAASNRGDAAVPVLNAIASYLKRLSLSLKSKKEIPFPTKNRNYNVCSVQGAALKLRLCIVGVVTCPDDGSSRRESDSPRNVKTTVLDALVGGQYRLPHPSSRTRVLAFGRAFENAGVQLSLEARNRLPVIAASAVSARGNAFQKSAQLLRFTVKKRLESEGGSQQGIASLRELEFAISATQNSPSLWASSASVSFLSSSPSEPRTAAGRVETDLFSMVGGNVKAKEALEDSLALDPVRRRQLSSLGFSAPTGVLLYGPPGTGKTLLAKAVANLLKSHGGSDQTIGGAFVSLRASDIVRAEVGNSEKLIVSAFRIARSNASSVIFIDEFQALFSERGGCGSGRLTSTLLQCMDDVTHWRDADTQADEFGTIQIVVLGATNTPWMIDKAFLRPGRFDSVVHVGLPNFSERVSILLLLVKRMRVLKVDNDSHVEALCKNVANITDGFSGADLVALCRAAVVRCLDEQGEGGFVAEKHFLEARNSDVSCSSSNELVQRISNWQP